MPELLEPQTPSFAGYNPEQKRQLMLQQGLDPERFDFDEQGRVQYKTQSPSVATTSSDLLAKSVDKPTPLGSFGRQAAAGVLPAGAGLVGGALAAAPFTGGTSLLLPIGAAILGGMGSSYLAAKGQEALMPDEWKAKLAEDVEVNPKSSMAGNVAASLAFLKPDFRSVKDVASGVRNIATGGASALSAAQKANALNIGLGGGIGAAASAYDDVSAGRDVDLGKLAISSIGNALINNPNKIGQRLGIAPNVYTEGGEANIRQQVAGDTRTLSQEAADNATAAAQAKAAEDAAAMKQALSELPSKYASKVKKGELDLRDAVILAKEDEAIAYRKGQVAAQKKMEPSVKEEVGAFGREEARYNELYSEYGQNILAQQETPRLKLEETRKVVDNQLAQLETDLELRRYTAEAARIEAENKRLAEIEAAYKERQKQQVRDIVAPTPRQLEFLKPNMERAQVAGRPEVRPTVSDEASLTLKPTVEPELPLTEGERIQQEYDLGKRRKQAVDQSTMTAEESATIQKAKGDLIQEAKSKNISLEPTVGFRDAMKSLAERRGVKLEMDPTITGAGETVSVEEQKAVRQALGKVVAKINPDKAGIDTWPHELIHPLITDMEIGPSKIGRELSEKIKAAAVGSEEVITDLSGKEVIRRLLDFDKESGGKKLYKDFMAYVKTKYGNPSLDDVKRLMSNRLLNEVDYAELNPAAAGQAASKVADELTGEEVRAQEVGNEVDTNRNLTQDEARPKFNEMRKAAGGQEKKAVESKDLKAAKFAGRKQEEGQAAKFDEDNRVFVTEFEKNLRRGEGNIGKLRANSEGKIDAKEVLTQMEKYNPGEVQLLKDAGIEEYLASKPKVTREELAKWVQENGPKVETIEYGMEGKVSAAKAEYDKMTHEWYDNLPAKSRHYLGDELGNHRIAYVDQAEINKAKKIVSELLSTPEGKRYKELSETVAKEPRDTSPRATSAYNGVSPKDPKKFPIQRVDVVLPGGSKQRYDELSAKSGRSDAEQIELNKIGSSRNLWQPDNLHENVPNTLGWAAIQYETLPNGEKVAHLFEVQSRWDQQQNQFKLKKSATNRDGQAYYSLQRDGNTVQSDWFDVTTPEDQIKAELGRIQNRNPGRVADYNPHPLLKDYNRLILKAVIDEARKKGATKIAISDADTAMMTEGHDVHANVVGPDGTILGPVEGNRSIAAEIIKNGGEYKGFKIQPPQEGGMRFNYDNALPRIAEELTGDKGVSVDLGEHKNAVEQVAIDSSLASMPGDNSNYKSQPRSNLIFTNPDGTPKTSVTGKMYDIYFPAYRRSQNEPFTMFGKKYQSEEQALPRSQGNEQINTPEFKKWFGDSKVVDSEGKPLVVYHGNSADFNVFDKNLTGDVGFYFTKDTKEASEYSRFNGEGSNVKPVFLQIKNPVPQDVYDEVAKVYGNGGNPRSSINKRLRLMGYDGRIIGDHYTVFEPTQIKSATGNFGAFDRSNPDIRYQDADNALPRSQGETQTDAALDPTSRQEVTQQVAQKQPLKLAFLDFMLGQSDKVKKVDEQLGDAFEKYFLRRSFYEGKYGNTIQSEMAAFSPETRQRVQDYMVAIDSGKLAPFRLNAEESKLHKTIQNYLTNVRTDGNNMGVLIEGVRQGKFNKDYLPNIVDRGVINTLVNKGNTPEAARYRKLWQDHIVKMSEGKVSAKEASNVISDYIAAIGGNNLKGMVEFGAVRKAEGLGLPAEMQEKDLMQRLVRYGNRVAKDYAYFQELQNKPEIAAKLGLRDQKGQPIRVDGIDKAEASNEDVRKAMKMVGDEGDNYHPVTNAFNRLVTNSLLGPLSGLRDIATIPTNVLPYINKLEDFGAFFKAASKIGDSWKPSLKAGARRENLDSLLYGPAGDSGSYAADKMNQVAQGLRVIQGREILEQGARVYTYTIGEELTRANIARASAGDKSSLKWLQEFGKIVDTTDFSSPASLKKLTTEDISKIAKSFTDRVQGGYDGRNLPLGITEGPAAPFFALSRWSVEKANVIRKDVLEPLARGNVKPFLMYTLGTLITGAAVEKLAEEVNNRRAADPTLNEAFKNSQAPTDEKIGYVIKALQLGSFAGILSDTMKAGWDLKEGRVPRGFSYPAADFISQTLGQNLSDAMAAIRDGEEPTKVWALFAEQVAKNTIQGYRIVNNNFINPEDVKRSEKFRDKAVFETMLGEKQPVLGQQARANPFIDTEYKDFKRAGSIEEVRETIGPAIEAAIKKSGGDEVKLMRELTSLKRNSYQTMPSPENMPREFLKYVLFLQETQGVEAATERVQEYLEMQELNKVKSQAIP